MTHSIVALIGDKEWMSSIGKQTSDTSFSVRALKKDESIINTLSPSKYPEKIWSLLFPLYLSSKVYLNLNRLDREAGEIMVALDLLGADNGAVHISPDIDEERFRSVVKGTVVEGYAGFDPDPAVLRESLYGLEGHPVSGNTRVIVDQAFAVKGVGTVALGFVVSGSVKKHQELITKPGKVVTQVRSIQIQDKDRIEAPSGSRVGLALKNIGPDDLPRGTNLVSGDSDLRTIGSMEAEITVSRFWNEELAEGSGYHAWSGLQFIPVRLTGLEQVDGKDRRRSFRVTAEFESPICLPPGERFGLIRLENSSFRFFGMAETK